MRLQPWACSCCEMGVCVHVKKIKLVFMSVVSGLQEELRQEAT